MLLPEDVVAQLGVEKPRTGVVSLCTWQVGLTILPILVTLNVGVTNIGRGRFPGGEFFSVEISLL